MKESTMADNEKGMDHNRINEQRHVVPMRVYVKDSSYEAPNTPVIFKSKWKPILEFEIDNKSSKIAEDTYEVVLTVSVRAILEDKTAYMAEVHQCGIFLLTGFAEGELVSVTNMQCLAMIYPYASAQLSHLVNAGGFPQLLLRPVNFQTLYEQRLEGYQAQENDTGTPQNA